MFFQKNRSVVHVALVVENGNQVGSTLCGKLKPCPFCGARAEVIGSGSDLAKIKHITDCLLCASHHYLRKDWGAWGAWNCRSGQGVEGVVTQDRGSYHTDGIVKVQSEWIGKRVEVRLLEKLDAKATT